MTAATGPGPQRTPARRKARQLATYLRAERPDYAYLKDAFRHLREEPGVEVSLSWAADLRRNDVPETLIPGSFSAIMSLPGV